MNCVNCENKIEQNDKYCRKCGIKIEKNAYYVLVNIMIFIAIIAIIGIIVLFIASFLV